jgi:hypothetical protein
MTATDVKWCTDFDLYLENREYRDGNGCQIMSKTDTFMKVVFPIRAIFGEVGFKVSKKCEKWPIFIFINESVQSAKKVRS